MILLMTKLDQILQLAVILWSAKHFDALDLKYVNLFFSWQAKKILSLS